MPKEQTQSKPESAEQPSGEGLSSSVLLAVLDNWLGREYISVRGVIVAMEGDMCRDPNFGCRTWDRDSLRIATHRINYGEAPLPANVKDQATAK